MLPRRETPLRAFLQASMLSTDTGQSGDEKDKPVRILLDSYAVKQSCAHR